MFGMGIGELVLIFVIALIVFGPDKLPSVARTVGKVVRDLKKTTDELSETIQREIGLDDIQSSLDLPAEVRRNMRNMVLPPDEVARRRKEKLKEIEERQAKRKLEESVIDVSVKPESMEKEDTEESTDG
ncbi:MAG: twin-arginine translocase subunit TatB [Acidobacteria bacterium]|nr:twin-arginine translocase subunit TatB [Acidobacteriota bacterium]